MRTHSTMRVFVAVFSLLASGCALRGAPASTMATPAGAEQATARYLESIRNDPSRVLLFLRDMPKGGDLHNHLGGAVYAESFIRWAAEDGLCLQREELRLNSPPCNAKSGELEAAAIPADAKLYGDVIDAWSMRNWSPARINGHDQFFESFGKFGPASQGRDGDMLAEVVGRAADQHVSYMELMHTPNNGSVIGLAMSIGFNTDLGRLRDRLIEAGLRDTLQAGRRILDMAESRERQRLGCEKEPAPRGCAVVVRYLYHVLRGLPPQAVFAQILAGFEMTRMDPRVVGFNLVMPEDDPVPMRDFRLHMQMIDFLHSSYPHVKISLHAGELAEGLVPPEGMKFHIRQSIERGHAQRIGHGTAILSETAPAELMREMAERKILVEIALSSSDAILGVKGPRHPIREYLRMGVPVALATDDEGVLRSTMTLEFRKAIEEQNFDYRTLKSLVRNSIIYSFADEGTKLRLLNQLDDDFTRFEEQHAATAAR